MLGSLVESIALIFEIPLAKVAGLKIPCRLHAPKGKYKYLKGQRSGVLVRGIDRTPLKALRICTPLLIAQGPGLKTRRWHTINRRSSKIFPIILHGTIEPSFLSIARMLKP